MNSVHVSVPLRAGKKMKKRKELDALVANSVTRVTTSNGKRGGGGVSSQDGLLSDSTDEDYWATEKVNGGRTVRRMVRSRRAFGALLKACTMVLVFSCVVATTTVMWLFIDVREQMASLRSEMDQVVAGSRGVQDSLQKCHSLCRELQGNQTSFNTRLSSFSKQIENYNAQVTDIQHQITKFEDQLKSVPKNSNDPENLKVEMALLGSRVTDLNATVIFLKDQIKNQEMIAKNIVQNITEMQKSIANILNSTQPSQSVPSITQAEKEAMNSRLNQLAANLTLLNETLTSKFQWNQDDLKTDHGKIVTLEDNAQNLSARIKTVEKEKEKLSDPSIMQTVTQLKDQVLSFSGQMNQTNLKLTELATEIATEIQNKNVEIPKNDVNIPPEEIIARINKVNSINSSLSIH